MQTQITDPNLEAVLTKLKPFGFNFHGYDESGLPLVVAPNGQVVEINTAISFANSEIAKKEETSPSSVELPPEMPQMPTSNTETKVESSPEQEKNAESSSESDTNLQSAPKSDFVIQTQAPQIELKTPKYIKPYGDGFEIKSFNAGNPEEATKFVEKNIKKNNKSSDKWLATMFKKFLEENKLNSQ